MRRDYSVISSAVYHVDPLHLRSLRLELMRRTRDTAYGGRKVHEDLTAEERGVVYDDLKEKIRAEGFKDECPIIVMLCRKDGKADKLLQGHHRLNIAIELGLATVPVRFVH